MIKVCNNANSMYLVLTSITNNCYKLNKKVTKYFLSDEVTWGRKQDF